MTPDAAGSLKVSEDQFVEVVAPRIPELAATTGSDAAENLRSAQLDRRGPGGLLWQEALHHRLLAVADLTAAAVAAGLVLGAWRLSRGL